MYKSIAEVKAANKSIGHFFFSRDSTKCFESRIESKLYKKTQMFVTSEVTSAGIREFSVRRVLPDGSIEHMQRGIGLYTARQICRGKLE